MEEIELQAGNVLESEQPSESLQKEDDINERDNKTSNELSEIKDLLFELSSQFDSKLKYDKHKDEIIDKLHAENQAYKNDLIKRTIMPFVNEIIFLIDDYSNLFKKYSDMDISEVDTAKLLKQFGNIPDDLMELLNKNGIESFSGEGEGEDVDFSKQKVIKTVPTNDPEKDKTVCEVIKKGFMMDGKIIRQEYVSCYKFENENINN
jgi:molecular chaperone GrpE